MSLIPPELTIESRYTNRVLSSVAFSLLYYDYVLTFPLEVKHYWRNGLSLASVLFFLNRYMSVISHIPVVVEFFGILPQYECRQLQQYHRIISAMTQGVVGALLALRTYALYNGNRRILSFLIMLGCIGVAVSLWVIIGDHNAKRPQTAPFTTEDGCDLTLSQDEGLKLAIAWSSILVFDAAVFALTVTRALRIGHMWRGGYFSIMLRDGVMYFSVLFVLYLSNILAYAFAQPVHKGASTSLTNVVSTILITRLMLNLRDPDRRGSFGSESSRDIQLQFVAFAGPPGERMLHSDHSRVKTVSSYRDRSALVVPSLLAP